MVCHSLDQNVETTEMIIMYDSITAADIPINAEAVAGYIDGSYHWSDTDWGRFPTAKKLRVAVFASTNDGHALDVEQGDATPSQAPAWVKMRKEAGLGRPLLYCNLSNLNDVHQAMLSAGESAEYWIASWVETGPYALEGAWGVQYDHPPHSGGHYDLSLVDESYWSADATTALRTLDFGDTGNDVAYAQELLASHNFPPNNSRRRDGSWDGIFGEGTRYQTQQFQTLSHLIGDGIIGPLTWKALAEHH